VSILKQEEQTEMETRIEEMEISTVFLKERTSNESELKQNVAAVGEESRSQTRN